MCFCYSCLAEMLVTKWGECLWCYPCKNSLILWRLFKCFCSNCKHNSPEMLKLGVRDREACFLRSFRNLHLPLMKQENCRHSESLLEPSIFSPARNWVIRMLAANRPFDFIIPPTCDLAAVCSCYRKKKNYVIFLHGECWKAAMAVK